MPTPLVNAVLAEAHDVPVYLSALGTVTGSLSVTVQSRVAGELQTIAFQEGQPVKKGQLLAQLDPRSLQAALEQAQGQLIRDQALLESAQQDLARYQTLWKQNSIAKQQLDNQIGLVKQYQGQVKLDQGTVDNAKVQLEYSKIIAPISGRAGLRQVDPGNIVQTDTTTGIVNIVQTQPSYIVFSLPENNLDALLRVRRRQIPLKVEAWDRNNQYKLAEGTLFAIDNQVGTTTGTINLKAKFDNEDDSLFPNQFVNVRLQMETRKQAVSIPIGAVQLGKKGNYVFVIDSQHKARLTPIVIGPEYKGLVVLEKGVQAGERVAISGLDKLKDGDVVQFKDPQEQNQNQ